MAQRQSGVNPREDARRLRWRGHREARRAQMVDAAMRVIRRRGADTGMDEIAAEAGVTKPVLYRQFTDKADLYLAVGRRAAEDLLARLTAELERDREPRAQVAAVVNVFLERIEEEPQLYRFVVRSSLVDTSLERKLVDDYRTLIAASLAAAIGEQLWEHGLDSTPAVPWSHGLVGLVQAAGEWWLEHRSEHGMDRASLTDHLTTLIWSGFAGVLNRG